MNQINHEMIIIDNIESSDSDIEDISIMEQYNSQKEHLFDISNTISFKQSYDQRNPTMNHQIDPEFVDQSGSTPIFYAAYNSNHQIFFYLWKLQSKIKTTYNSDNKAFIHYIIDNDDIFLFRFVVGYFLAVDYNGQKLLDYIISKDSIKCYKYYKYKYLPYKQLTENKNQPKILSFQKTLRIRNLFNSILETQTNYQSLTVIGVIIMLLLQFSFSPVYIESDPDLMISNLAIIMLSLYWLFWELWFITYSYSNLDTLGKYQFPRDSEIISAFKDVSDDNENNRYKLLYNRLGQGKPSEIIYQQIKDGKTDIDLDTEQSRICPSCDSFKQYGTVHCYICDHCVSMFDHHNFFYKRCINQNNHFSYMIVLLLQFACLFLYLLRVFVFYFSSGRNILTFLLQKEGKVGLVYYSFLLTVLLYTGRNIQYSFRGIINNQTVDEHKRSQKLDYIEKLPKGTIKDNIINYMSFYLSETKLK